MIVDAAKGRTGMIVQRSMIGLAAATSRKRARAVVTLLCGLPLQKGQTMKASAQVSIGFQTPVRFTYPTKAILNLARAYLESWEGL